MYKNLLFLLIALPFLIQAQINESDTARLQLRTNITGNYQAGNVQLFALRGRIELSASGKNFVFKTQNNGLYQSFFKTKADADLFSRNFLYYRPQQPVYPFVMGFVASNYRLKINTRVFVGGGATWQMIKSSKSNLKLSASVVYEQTNFSRSQFNNTHYTGQNQIRLWRATSWLAGQHRFNENGLRLHYNIYYQPGLDGQNNYRISGEAGLDFPIYKGLGFTMLYTNLYEQVVVSGVQQRDALFSFGLNYQLKKR